MAKSLPYVNPYAYLVATALAVMPVQALAQEPQMAPWQLTGEALHSTIGEVRAGKSLKPQSWPGGAKVAVMFSFDADFEAAHIVGLQPNPGPGQYAEGEYGARVGLDRVLAALAEYDVPASFFVPGANFESHPEIVGKITAPGIHEIGLHGWIHAPSQAVPLEAEIAAARKALETIEAATGTRPVGYRAPMWQVTPDTMAILQELDLLYDSSLMADDNPYQLIAAGKPLDVVELPVSWLLNDWPLLHGLSPAHTPARDVLDMYVDEFDRAYAEGSSYTITLHPQIIGRRSRIFVLEELLKHIASHEGVWFATHRQVAEHVSPAIN